MLPFSSDFMRSLISDMDLRSLEVRLFKAKVFPTLFCECTEIPSNMYTMFLVIFYHNTPLYFLHLMSD